MAMTISGTSGITYPDSTTQASGSKAWVNFNGTGVVAIRAQYNVTSITDNGTGNYTVNFTNAMSDANYAVQGTCNNSSGGSGNIAGIYATTTAGAGTNMTTSACQILVLNDGAAAVDTGYTFFSFFR